MQQAELGLESSRRSESTLGAHMTAPSEGPSGLGEVGHAPASPLASVQQRLRKISAQSLSGFSDPGTSHSAVEDRPDCLRNAGNVDRGSASFLQGSQGTASQPDSGGGDVRWGMAGEGVGSGDRHSSGSGMLLYIPCTDSCVCNFCRNVSSTLRPIGTWQHCNCTLASRLTL